MFDFLEEEQFKSCLSLAMPDHGDSDGKDEDEEETKLPPDDG